MEEPHDNSMAAISVQRNRDIRVVAEVIIDPFLKGALSAATGSTNDLQPCTNWFDRRDVVTVKEYNSTKYRVKPGYCTAIGKIDSSRVFVGLLRSSRGQTAKIGESGELAAVLEGRLSLLQRFAAAADSQLFENLATLENRVRRTSPS